MAEAKGINPEITTPEVVKEEVKEMATAVTEEVKEATAEVKEEVIEAPSKIRQTLGQLSAAMWEQASVRPSVSGSDEVVLGSSLSGMYGSKFDALAKEHEQVRPDKG
jgi:hypothetical protein